MFFVSLTYRVPLEEVEPHMAGHMEWLKKYYDAGVFMASGRKVPRTGGVIFARGERAVLEACLAEDPFAIHKLADCEIVEFSVSTAIPGMEALKG